MIRRVAITGATGFIGRHLTAHLASRGISVQAIQRPESRRTAPEGATVVRARLDAASLAPAFAGVDAVVHLAGVVSSTREREFFDVNVEGTRAVAAAARAADVRVIHVSSLAAAGPASPTAPRTEEDPPRPVTPYGRSKLEGERVLAADATLRWTILRPGVVYGPGDRAMLPLFALATRGVLPLVGRATAAYTFVYVDDLVSSIVAALDAEPDRHTLFVGHPQPVAARHLLEGIRSALGRAAVIVPVPMALTRLAALAGDVGGAILGRPLTMNSSRYVELAAEGFVCRVDRLRERLGIVAQTDLSAGLTRTAAWYRKNGWL
ncbi:MAG: NAD-dependent epimerase/dehydratase family protein [Acidobacteria bacterium]|nr:NAD-dependent epimerase/dehydratase family protein [Acidobacteriota bacterium]